MLVGPSRSQRQGSRSSILGFRCVRTMTSLSARGTRKTLLAASPLMKVSFVSLSGLIIIVSFISISA